MRDAACNAVDNLEMNIEPTPPGSPVYDELRQPSNMQSKDGRDEPAMTTASNANPSYRLTNVSSTIPVPLLTSIAANSGVQPCVSRCPTYSFFRVMTVQPTAAHVRRITMMSGMGVLIMSKCKLENRPRRATVTRSPRHAATGGAILSVGMGKIVRLHCGMHK